MKYAVQYVRPGVFGRPDIVEDTNPISYEEAIALYQKHREDFIKVLSQKEDAQLVVWEDVGDGEFPIYGTELVDLDTRDNLTYRHDTFYKNVPVEVKEPN